MTTIEPDKTKYPEAHLYWRAENQARSWWNVYAELAPSYDAPPRTWEQLGAAEQAAWCAAARNLILIGNGLGRLS